MTTSSLPTRPEIMELTEGQRDTVHALLGRTDVTCPNCASTDFRVENALYLGFLFLNEDTDIYIVGLTCLNPDCSLPRTGVKLHKRDFLE